MIAKGATSVWERWDQDTRDPGMNGESQMILAGNLAAWFYQTLAGINYDPARPGFRHVVLRPRPVGDLSWVTASHKCLYGTIRSAWRIRGRRLSLERDRAAEHHRHGLCADPRGGLRDRGWPTGRAGRRR